MGAERHERRAELLIRLGGRVERRPDIVRQPTKNHREAVFEPVRPGQLLNGPAVRLVMSRGPFRK
jgi:hypothetical protein